MLSVKWRPLYDKEGQTTVIGGCKVCSKENVRKKKAGVAGIVQGKKKRKETKTKKPRKNIN